MLRYFPVVKDGERPGEFHGQNITELFLLLSLIFVSVDTSVFFWCDVWILLQNINFLWLLNFGDSGGQGKKC